MKRLYILMIALFAFNMGNAQDCSSWKPLLNNTHCNFHSIYFISADTGFAVGENFIYKTVNGGLTWKYKTTELSSNLFSLYFTNSDTGYVIDGHGKILKTVDKGEIWEVQSNGDGTTGYLNYFASLYFSNANTIYAVGYYGKIIKTIDGGANWATQTSSTTEHLNSIFFVNADTGYAVGYNGTILKTTNGGINWAGQASGTTNCLSTIYFINADTGYIAGIQGTILKTCNGGSTWISQTNGLWYNTFSIYFVNSNIGYVVGYNGQIGKTTDGGTTWIQQTSGTTTALQSVYFTNADTGYAVGDQGLILKTSNGGINWTIQLNGSINYLYSVKFPNDSTGYTVGDHGLILKTINKGETWTTQISNTVQQLNSVFFVNKDTGYAVGTAGAIIKTTDGGANWTLQTSGTNYRLNSVFFVNSNVGYVVGGNNYPNSNAIILKTTNGGLTWIVQPCGNAINLQSIYLTDSITGYTVSITGQIFKTTNGGVTWLPQTSGTFDGLFSIYFTNADTGYIVGKYGKVLKTIDGGVNWTLQLSGTSNDLFSVYFVNANIGYAVGYNGILIKTFDGGNTWTTRTSYNINSYYSICFTDLNTGYIVGPNQICEILKTTNGGETTIYPQSTPEGSIQRCVGAGTSIYKTTAAINATSYKWSLLPTVAGSISGSDTIGTINWNPSFTGSAYVSVYGINGSCNNIPTSLNIKTVTLTSNTFNLKNPSNNTFSSATPLFKWDTSSTANYYRLYVDGTLKKDNITTCNYQTLNSEAISHGLHNWYITVGGCPIQSNQTWNIKIDAEPPAAFNLISPSDSSWTNSLHPTFSWSASGDTNSGLAMYQLWIDGWKYKDSISVSATSVISEYSLWNGLHSWMIKAIDSVGNIRNSTQSWIIKIDSLAPICNLKTPANNQFLSNTTPTFTWSAIDAGIGIQKSQLFIDGVLAKDSIIDTIFTIINPLSNGQHTWWIKVFDSLGNNMSSTSRILNIDNAKPNEFNLISPLNNQTVNIAFPNLSWQSTADSTGGSGMLKYQLWINGVKNRDSIPTSQTILAPSIALVQGAYTWYILAYDKVGNIRQSTQTWSFFVDWEAPTAFNLIEPIDNAIMTISRPTFKWHSSSDISNGMQRYELCISGQPAITILPTDTTKILDFDLPNGAYTWYVKAYDSAGLFTSSNTYALTINDPLPNQAATPTGSIEYCLNSVNTNFTTLGASNATSYVWTIMPLNAGNISGTGLTSTVDWNNTFTGIAEISVKGYNTIGYGTASLPLIVTVYPATIAGFVSGNGSICIGDSTGTLTLIGNNGKIITWQKKLNNAIWSDIIDTTTTYSEIPTSTGAWSYRAKVQSGVCSLLFSDSVIVIVNPLPFAADAISGTTTVSQGQNAVNYTVPIIANATSYIWILPNGATGASTTNSIMVNYGANAVSGNITVKGSNSCGDGVASSLYVTVNPFVLNCSAQFNLVADTATPHHYFVVNNASGIPPLHYYWSWGDGTHDTIAYPAHTYSTAGYYNICLTITDSVGCTNTYCDSSYLQKSPNAIISVQVIPQGSLGINTNILSDKIKIYPNPATNKLTINLQQLTNLENTSVSIYDIQGQLLLQQTIKHAQTELNISKFAKGVYIVKINNDKNSMISKFVKE